MKKKILISGMTCGHCVKRVEKALLSVEGVISAEVSLEDNSATVETNRNIEDHVIREVIDDAGYDVEDIQ